MWFWNSFKKEMYYENSGNQIPNGKEYYHLSERIALHIWSPLGLVLVLSLPDAQIKRDFPLWLGGNVSRYL